jgi:hypothetical protein
MAVVGRGGTDGGFDRDLVGLKIEVSPELLSPAGSGTDRSTSPSKIFTLIPPYVRSVRELKNHLSNVVLKTHVPFFFYNGEYRIPDEDDVRIFTLMDEPCRYTVGSLDRTHYFADWIWVGFCTNSGMCMASSI